MGPPTTTTDFMTWGECELRDGEASVADVRQALLPHQPRRCLVQPVLLCSDNSKSSGFITPAGLTSFRAIPFAAKANAPATSHSNNSCTDFTLWGEAAEGPSGFALEGVRRSLCPARFARRPVSLNSSNSRCTDFVTGGLCSTPLTPHDVLWMEKVARLKPGTLFKALCGDDVGSKTEHSWNPMRRFASLGRALRGTKGAKTTEHLAILRTSDPLSSISGWLDWHALYEQCKQTHAARVHQQALVDRAMRVHKRMTYDMSLLRQQSSNANGLKRSMHLGRLKTVDEIDVFAERNQPARASNDSVIAFDIDTPPSSPLSFPAKPPPGESEYAKKRNAQDPSSPNGVMGMVLPPLDEAIHMYKLVSGPGYGDEN